MIKEKINKQKIIGELENLLSKMKEQLIPGKILHMSFDNQEERFKQLLHNSNFPLNIINKYESIYSRDIGSKIELNHGDLNYIVK